ncbi:class I SAM-dependent methyltransferase [Actinoplanes sp. NPDC051861]|uniref:class I SAM-dependent methyltransferase n=1 Tax=Actinoplanes sp. NPDC051861 TaxID=3155170 RepID=UPI00342CC062
MFDARASASYDRRATRLLNGLYRRVASEVAAAAPPGAAVLDIGTGPGRLPLHLARLRPDLALTGADLSPDMVAIAERAAGSARIAFRVADVADLPWPDASTDLIVSTLSAHEWPEPERAAAELIRVLRPGGRLMIYDFRFARLGRLARELPVERAALHRLSLFTCLRTPEPVGCL